MDEAPREEDGEDVDDAFRAVLEGLRTTLPGVQILFAFLLILPLQVSFAALEVSERVAFYFAFFGSAVASILLIAPSAHQRIRAPISGVKRRSAGHLHMTVRITIAGTIVFAVALVAAVYLVSSLVIDSTMGVVLATIAVAGLLGWSWFYVPLVTFSTQNR
jgi:hypothetical protein